MANVINNDKNKKLIKAGVNYLAGASVGYTVGRVLKGWSKEPSSPIGNVIYAIGSVFIGAFLSNKVKLFIDQELMDFLNLEEE